MSARRRIQIQDPRADNVRPTNGRGRVGHVADEAVLTPLAPRYDKTVLAGGPAEEILIDAKPVAQIARGMLAPGCDQEKTVGRVGVK